jgi:ribosomal protein S18 acetylase RimI-like enzyme
MKDESNSKQLNLLTMTRINIGWLRANSGQSRQNGRLREKNYMSIRIIKASENDLAVLASLFDAYRRFYGREQDIDGARTFLADRLRNDESVIFLARNVDGESLGFTQLYPLFTSVGMRRIWLLNDLYVTEKARRSGVASGLIDAARAHAKATDATGVLLETQIENRNAQRLYEKLGFRRNEETWFYYLDV